MSHFFSNMTSGWTLPGGLSVADDDDQRRLKDFLWDFPDIRAAVAKAIENAAMTVVHAAQVGANPLADRSLGLQQAVPAPGAALEREAAAGPDNVRRPRAPQRMSGAIAKFADRAEDSKKSRTVQDQVRLLRNLVEHVVESAPELGPDPWVHDIGTHHVSAFIDAEKSRPGKRTNAAGEQADVSASTLKKKLVDLRPFFGYARDELSACDGNPIDGLGGRIKALTKSAAKAKQSYWPFNDAQIARIFEPALYLSHNRDPDYFWCPLLAVHLGVRLGEVVRTRLEHIGQDAAGLWYLEIVDEVGKNDNSVRRIPLTAPLIELGFGEYVEHVRRLGATQLWPHRDLGTPTAERLPSKNQSQAFGAYLSKIGLDDPRLVYHSFRHTVVTALLDGGTPLHISMQIVGHEAQDHAVRTGLIRPSATRSVHLGTYAHSTEERMGTDSTLQPLKEALERCVQPRIDYARLRIAAQIVREHTRKRGNRFITGWPAQRHTHTEAQLKKLEFTASQHPQPTLSGHTAKG